MPISPMTQTETHVQFNQTWLTDPDPVTAVRSPVNLAGATIVMIAVPRDGTAPFIGAGTVNITNAAAGQFTYTIAATDVAASKGYDLWFRATFGDGTILFSDPQPWVLRPKPI